MAITSGGKRAYARASVIFWPSVSIQLRNSVMTCFFAGSAIFDGISNHVKLEIGYAFFPAALVIEIRKSWGICVAALLAAVVTLAKSALTKFPAALRTWPYGILFWMA